MKLLFRCAIVLAPLLPLAVSQGSVGAAVLAPSSTPAAWPLARVEVTAPAVFREAKKGLYLEGAPGVPLSKLMRLTVFGGFRPGLSIADAATSFGTPAATRSERGKDVAVYDVPAARIEVTDELSGSGCVSYRRRTLYAYPKPSRGGCGLRAAETFDDSLANRIPEQGSVEVAVAEAGGGERAWALVRDGCIEGLNWWAPTSQREPDGSPVHSDKQ